MIELSGVTKAFRRRAVLDGVSLSIGSGTRVALVGSNGAGKTTLIRCLLGEYVCEGAVSVAGINPRANRRDALKRIGFVPQQPPPLHMPVNELVRFSARVSDGDPKRMESVADSLGLDMASIRSQPFVKLSGGQKQKLLIGIALGRDCDFLIMDEPAANLDPESRQVFFRLLAERQDETVMMISSHRLDEVAALVNRVVELDRGKVVLDDHVAVDLASTLDCTIGVSRHEEALSKALGEWGFKRVDGKEEWEGRIAGPDRLRFLAMVSRYAGLLSSLDMRGGNGS